jgi:hypothetical protein
VLLNDPTFVEAARALAQSIIRTPDESPSGRIDFLFRQVLARAPSPSEQEVLLTLYTRQLARYRDDEAAATELLAVGKLKRPVNFDAAELAAWTNLARVVLNQGDLVMRR